MEQLHPKLVEIALDGVSGSRFEQFAQEFYGAIRGRSFVPLGGVHDKGADGFVSKAELAAGKPAEFVLMSVQEDTRAKVQDDVARLREVGREPKTVVYLTSRTIKHIDEVENDLSDELGVIVRVRDGRYIADQINHNAATIAAFEHHLRAEVAFLRHVGKAPLLARSTYVESPDVYVFLHQELERTDSHSSLVEAVIDALILWSLEGTDPDEGRFMTREEVIAKIQEIIPSAGAFVHASRVNDRLQTLASKSHAAGRAIRWHKKDNHYCLPYETRSYIEQENIEDHGLLVEVKRTLASRIEDNYAAVLTDKEVAQASELCLEAVRRTFEREGLSFARFLEQKPETESRITVSDAVNEVLNEAGIPAERRAVISEAVLGALRDAFYASTEAERRYLSKLSRTFALFFTLRTEPTPVQYFQEMASDFYLYVGSDIIVRALSERYLPTSDQMTRNMLEMARDAGATLILAEPVLDEIWFNLRTSDTEFREHFENLEPYLKDATLPSQSDKILVRAYFYARMEPDKHVAKPGSWPGYVQQFCDYGDLYKPAGRNGLRDYLTAQFGFEYVTRDDVERFVDPEELAKLTDQFKDFKAHEALAKNDATMILAVYGRREAEGESGRGSEFGFRTWWLTSEGRVVKPTRDLLREKGRWFAMRPEFLLNFISLVPSAAAVRDAYRNVFPSLQGIRLGKRLDQSAYDQLMKDVDEAMDLEPGRRQAHLAKLSDQLKADFSKRYVHTLSRV